MDLITQGALGAITAQSVAQRTHLGSALLLGWFAGMAADLDVLISSSNDPLLFLEFHRQFTHSIFFIPIGGLICALTLHALFHKRTGLSFLRSTLYCTTAYASHGLLDSCTSYGTLLLWPLSDTRFAWDNVSIIDPAITVPLISLMTLAKILQRRLFAQLAMIWVVAYLIFGAFQHKRVIEVAQQVAQARGHTASRLEAKPSFANVLLWKTIYEADGFFYVDAVRLGKKPRRFKGQRIKKLNVAQDLPWLTTKSQQAKDIERFRWFSDDYLALDHTNKNKIIDIRYSLLPNQIDALWSIEVSKDKNNWQHVTYKTHHSNTASKLIDFKRMLFDD